MSERIYLTPPFLKFTIELTLCISMIPVPNQIVTGKLCEECGVLLGSYEYA